MRETRFFIGFLSVAVFLLFTFLIVSYSIEDKAIFGEKIFKSLAAVNSNFLEEKKISGNIYRDDPAKILFGGDMMLARTVNKFMERNGADYPFEKIKEFLSQGTFVANLEGPVMENNIEVPAYTTRFSFPSSVAELLKNNNVKIVSLANNHTLDYGKEGFEETQNILSKNGIEYFGHPTELSGDYVLKQKIDGRDVTFISMNATYPNFNKEKAGLIVSQNKNKENFLVVFIHWGEEYETKSNSFQNNLGHYIVDQGADLVVGTHPHVVEEAELYKGKIIFYSLGNFIFDQYFSKETQEGLVVEAKIFDNKINYELFPVKIFLSQPILMEGDEKTTWLDNFSKASPSVEISGGEISVPI